MNLVADDRISGTHDFTSQFVLFPTPFGGENSGQKLPPRLTRDQLGAFLNAERDKAHSAHFFTPPPEPPGPPGEKRLAAGVLTQAACDLRRFQEGSTGGSGAMYAAAYSWIR